jgi:hypothetical protein
MSQRRASEQTNRTERPANVNHETLQNYTGAVDYDFTAKLLMFLDLSFQSSCLGSGKGLSSCGDARCLYHVIWIKFSLSKGYTNRSGNLKILILMYHKETQSNYFSNIKTECSCWFFS